MAKFLAATASWVACTKALKSLQGSQVTSADTPHVQPSPHVQALHLQLGFGHAKPSRPAMSEGCWCGLVWLRCCMRGPWRGPRCHVRVIRNTVQYN